MKNSALFIVEALNTNESINWCFAVSHGVRDLLLKYNIPLDERFYFFDRSPARNKDARKELINVANKISPDVVFTMAGPAYVDFPFYHVQGLSNAYITHADNSAYNLEKNLIKRWRLLINSKLRLYYSKKADFFMFQTEEARSHYCKRTKISLKDTIVINNSFDIDLKEKLSKLPQKQKKDDNKYIFFCPGAAYIHKGFQFLPEIVKELSEMTKATFEFVITLPESPLLNEVVTKCKNLNVDRYIKNIGPFIYSQVDELYYEADFVFVPSLLETFSATYLEAIVAKKGLIVADKGFAKEVCEDAAFYVDPQNAKEAAKTIAWILEHPEAVDRKAALGVSILEKYGDQADRFNKITNLLISKAEKDT